VQEAVDAVTALLYERVVPAAIELIDADSLRAAEQHAGKRIAEGQALLLIECDGTPTAVEEEIVRVTRACETAGALEVGRSAGDAERDELWAIRRQVSLALRATGLHKINHDVVVPRGRIPELFDVVDELRRDFALNVACFGHAGDGNIHVNFMIRPDDAEARGRAKQAERVLFERVVALEGSISGEHGIGFAKAPYLSLELDAAQIALLKRVKAAFDPRGILNPGKIF
jgi:FAD/FMN-containing dehydrogenase